ncbi:hypothetical protein COS23_02240 [bacterium (Candidatus Moisslbacteria) CG02_land_8_20_14_3_00_36_53]|nr:MAG: hypothetical protein COS23_02240 [bacterium (Candidatus Moisslbacteria) CG02_land_8_20_14_3_00_36_53]
MPRKINKPLLFWLTIFSVMVVIFGFWQIRYNIISPFRAAKPVGQVSQEDIVGVYKNLDTDKDGLSDYEEINKYGTSAFLPDSDGDGVSDKEEIDASSNPLNPQSTPTNKGLAGTGEGSSLVQEVKQEIVPSSEEISATEIRDLLVNKGGLSRELVDQMLDEDLIKLYNETKKETGIDLSQLSKEAVKSENLSEAQKMVSEMDPKILRQLLISQGVDSKILETISDEDLKNFFLQTLGQTQR